MAEETQKTILYKIVFPPTEEEDQLVKVYEPGKYYRFSGTEGYLTSQFSFITDLQEERDFFGTLINKKAKVFEIEPLGNRVQYIPGRCATNYFKVIRELPRSEWPGFQFDEDNNLIYWENSDGSLWEKLEYDEKGRLILQEFSNGRYSKFQYDEDGYRTYHETNKYSIKYVYDENHNLLSLKDSRGYSQISRYDENNNLIYRKYSSGSTFNENLEIYDLEIYDKEKKNG